MADIDMSVRDEIIKRALRDGFLVKDSDPAFNYENSGVFFIYDPEKPKVAASCVLSSLEQLQHSGHVKELIDVRYGRAAVALKEMANG